MFSINDVAMAEGNGGGTNAFTFTITRSTNLTDLSSVVTFSTANGSATAPEDFAAIVNGTVTFGQNDSSRDVTVFVNADLTPEFDEIFTITITNVTNGAIARATGTGTIVNDDNGIPVGVGFEGDVVDGSGGPAGDGLILANDVSVIRQFILGTRTPVFSPNQFQRSDVNTPCGNGQIDAGDVTVIRQMILGTIPNNTPTCGPTVPAISAPIMWIDTQPSVFANGL